ncbi:MAG: hypothetical protein ACLT8E_08220 [Akkermansia sp.]
MYRYLTVSQAVMDMINGDTSKRIMSWEGQARLLLPRMETVTISNGRTAPASRPS